MKTRSSRSPHLGKSSLRAKAPRVSSPVTQPVTDVPSSVHQTEDTSSRATDEKCSSGPDSTKNDSSISSNDQILGKRKLDSHQGNKQSKRLKRSVRSSLASKSITEESQSVSSPEPGASTGGFNELEPDGDQSDSAQNIATDNASKACKENTDDAIGKNTDDEVTGSPVSLPVSDSVSPEKNVSEVSCMESEKDSDIEEISCASSEHEIVELSDSDDENSSIPSVVNSESISSTTSIPASVTSCDAEVLASMIRTLEKTMAGMKAHYETQLKKKEDVIARMENEIKFKDEQLVELETLVQQNMELEAKISHILSDEKAYESEIEKLAKAAENRDKKAQDSKAEEEKEAEGNSDLEVEESGTDEPKQAMKKRRTNDTEDGEDIDAYFVQEKSKESDSDVEIVEEQNDSVKPLPVSPVKTVTSNIDESDSNKLGRHNIRKLITGSRLTEETKTAAKQEKERMLRVEKEHAKHIVTTITDPKTKLPLTTRLVLATNEPGATPLVEVNKKLVKKLKPHQIEAVEFMWDSLIESVDRMRSGDAGTGCILAHCMGLGKTLSVVALVHTLLSCLATKNVMKTCLVVCPLNTVLNWQYEWEKWLDRRDRLKVYELASVKGLRERTQVLSEWQETGGVMIVGYQMFRLLATYHGKSKRIKQSLEKNLIDPGPDIVVCDEGHVLKNDMSAMSKSINKIHTKRRIVLTGTPLQNNLVEYHCMVNFVKKNLVGTRREFGNRFVNPIVNGQHSDSTPADVKIMKKRAHVLHEMLDGCVQRRDYSALTKLLPTKHEYVISVRLSPLQMALYEEYLKKHQPSLEKEGNSLACGATLFSDYQNLMRVWTHPWVLKMEQIRQEKKMVLTESDDDELESLIYTSSSEEEVTEEDTASSLSDTEDQVTSSKLSNGRSGRHVLKKRKPDKSCDEDSAESENDLPVVRTTRQRSKQAAEQKVKDEVSEKSTASQQSEKDDGGSRKAKVIAGEVIRSWKSTSRGQKDGTEIDDDPFKRLVLDEAWWQTYVKDEHERMLHVSGKLVILLDIIRMANTLRDKVLVFSQSLLTLDLIERFLALQTEENKSKSPQKKQKNDFNPSHWIKDEDYCRMDGSTQASHRKRLTTSFNNTKNSRLRLFLISTKAGGLGINLEAANRVIIFDASWNPSHDIQSIFRVYRFGQEKDVFVYRLLAQGTMEEKIYERQVTKETLSQRVIDKNQMDRHFAAADVKELYQFQPDRLDDPDREPRPTPPVPKDMVLAEVLTQQSDWVVLYHEHDSLLEKRPEEDLTEDERKAAWEEYEREKHGFYTSTGSSVYNSQAELVTNRPNPFNTNQVSTASGAGQGAKVKVICKKDGAVKDPKKNSQLLQLPRVVQEILKYNPSISPQELQERLHAFLGMHGQSITVMPGFIKPVGTSKPHVNTKTVQQPMVIRVKSGKTSCNMLSLRCVSEPGSDGTAPVTTITLPSLPSRLPKTGFVPAMRPT